VEKNNFVAPLTRALTAREGGCPHGSAALTAREGGCPDGSSRIREGL